jgi:hypothetical protein
VYLAKSAVLRRICGQPMDAGGAANANESGRRKHLTLRVAVVRHFLYYWILIFFPACSHWCLRRRLRPLAGRRSAAKRTISPATLFIHRTVDGKLVIFTTCKKTFLQIVYSPIQKNIEADQWYPAKRASVCVSCMISTTS